MWPILTRWTELATAVGEFAQTVSDLGASDLGKSVSHSLEALAELERKAQETESAQARADQATLLSTADEYARLVNSVRVSAMTAFMREPRMLTCMSLTDGVQFARASVPHVAECRRRAPPPQADARAQSRTRQDCD